MSESHRFHQRSLSDEGRGFYSLPPKTPVSDEYRDMIRDLKKRERKDVWGKIAKFSSMLVLVVIFLVAELFGGIFGNSLALLSDAFHMTSDSISHTIGLIAVILSMRKKTTKLTFGWARSEVLGAMINSIFLLSVVYFIYVEAIQRFLSPEPITEPMMVLVVGGMGLAVNVLGLFIFGADEGGEEDDEAQIRAEDHQECCYLAYERDKALRESGHIESENDPTEKKDNNLCKKIKGTLCSKTSQNVRAVFLHIFGDFLGSVGVMISATILLLVPVEMDGDHCVKNCVLLYLDPFLSITIASIIFVTTFPLFIATCKTLMQSVPGDVKISDIEREIREKVGLLIRDVHQLQVWNLAGTRNIATMHVELEKPSKFTKVSNQIKMILHDHGIHTSTIQPEFLTPHELTGFKGILKNKFEDINNAIKRKLQKKRLKKKKLQQNNEQGDQELQEIDLHQSEPSSLVSEIEENVLSEEKKKELLKDEQEEELEGNEEEFVIVADDQIIVPKKRVRFAERTVDIDSEEHSKIIPDEPSSRVSTHQQMEIRKRKEGMIPFAMRVQKKLEEMIKMLIQAKSDKDCVLSFDVDMFYRKITEVRDAGDKLDMIREELIQKEQFIIGFLGSSSEGSSDEGIN